MFGREEEIGAQLVAAGVVGQAGREVAVDRREETGVDLVAEGGLEGAEERWGEGGAGGGSGGPEVELVAEREECRDGVGGAEAGAEVDEGLQALVAAPGGVFGGEGEGGGGEGEGGGEEVATKGGGAQDRRGAGGGGGEAADGGEEWGCVGGDGGEGREFGGVEREVEVVGEVGEDGVGGELGAGREGGEVDGAELDGGGRREQEVAEGLQAIACA